MFVDEFIVENGEGLINSNSYVSIEEATDYYSIRLYSEWDELSLELKQALLISATYFVDEQYNWAGYRKYDDQSLNFPRTDVYNPRGQLVEDIPNSIKRAVMEAARKMLIKSGDTYIIKDLIPDREATPIKSLKEKFDVMEQTVTYMTASDLGVDYKMFPSIDKIIPNYLLSQVCEDNCNVNVPGWYVGKGEI